MHGTGPLRRRRHRRSWQRVRNIGLGILVVVLTVELVYRLVALPSDYREQRLAVRSTETVATATMPAEPEIAPQTAPQTVLETALAIEPAAGAPLDDAGLRLDRRLELQPRRDATRLVDHAALAAAVPEPAAVTASAPVAGDGGGEAAASLVSVPIAPLRPLAPGDRRAAPLVAIVIDDMGYSPAALGRLARLPGPLTLAFLPYADATGPMLQAAKRGDFELMLHLPMQPLGDADPGPEALLVGLEPDELRRRVRWAISRVPGAVGVNNHMGSRFTADAGGLEVVMAELRRHGLYFLDSRTNAQSLAERVARASGLPASRRNVFIDHDPEPRAVARQLALVERVARLHGNVVAIGHPYPTTLAALEAWLPSLEQRGFRLARVSEVIAARLCSQGLPEEECGPALYLAGGDAAIVPQGAGEAAP